MRRSERLTAPAVLLGAVAIVVTTAPCAGQTYPLDEMLANARFTPSRDYAQDLFNLNRSSLAIQSSEDDGWPLLQESLERFQAAYKAVTGEPFHDEEGNRDKSVDFKSLIDEWDASSKEKAKARLIVDTLVEEGVFDRMRRLGSVKGAVRPRYEEGGPLLDMTLPELAVTRELVRLQRFRIREAAERGKWTTVSDATEETLALARTFLRQGAIIERQLGVVMAVSVFEEVAHALSERRTDAKTLERLSVSVESVPDHDVTAVLQVERLFVLDAIERCYPADGDADAPTSASMVRKANEMFEMAGSVVARPKPTFVEYDEWRKGLPPPFRIIYFLSPGIEKAMLSREQLRVHRLGMSVLFAVERYRAARKSLPGSLDDLVPQYLQSLPSDPFSPSKATFGYRLIDPETDPAHRRYLLYSVGWDGEDNKGRENGRGNIASILDAKGSGSDYLINPER